MTRRAGSTLIEVLVAIFIMGIGMIALLTLFPIGALRMAQAIQDERSQQAAINAHALSIINNVHNDPKVVADPIAGLPDVFSNPAAAGVLPDADPNGPSYPVFVDPIGFLSSPIGKNQDYLAGNLAVRRRIPAYVTSNALCYNWFTLLDDLAFDSATGTPQISGTAVLRDTRYSWAYLLQRPRTSDSSIVTCATVVFNKRPLAVTVTSSLAEYAYTNKSYFDPTNNLITIDYTANVPPPVGVGDWIMDASFYQKAVNGVNRGSAHGYFYRIVSVNDIGSNLIQYEVQTPLRGPWSSFAVSPTGYGYVGTAIVLEGVSEVFERGPVRLP